MISRAVGAYGHDTVGGDVYDCAVAYVFYACYFQLWKRRALFHSCCSWLCLDTHPGLFRLETATYAGRTGNSGATSNSPVVG